MSHSVTSRILFVYICAYILCIYCIYILLIPNFRKRRLLSLFHHIEVEYTSILSVRVSAGKLCRVRFAHIWRATYKSMILQ